MSTEAEHLRGQLRTLGLRAMADVFEEEATKAAKSQTTYTAFLAKLIDEELAAKVDRSVNARLATYCLMEECNPSPGCCLMGYLTAMGS